MKSTYLVFKQINGVRKLVSATQKEWEAILKENKHLPQEKKRRFILDCIQDGSDYDRMYIEVSKEEYAAWHSRHVLSERKRKEGMQHSHVSLDTEIQESEVSSLHECVLTDYDLESLVVDRVLLSELESALRAWKPWAPELLRFYMNGEKRTCTETLCQKYGLKKRAIEYRKKSFEAFVKKFLK